MPIKNQGMMSAIFEWEGDLMKLGPSNLHSIQEENGTLVPRVHILSKVSGGIYPVEKLGWFDGENVYGPLGRCVAELYLDDGVWILYSRRGVFLKELQARNLTLLQVRVEMSKILLIEGVLK
jgi:hypothetical protein